MDQIAGFTTFENTCVDSTFAKSKNNKFNVVHKNDVKILIDYYSNKLVDMDELEGLRFPARKFINREDLSNKDKLKYLNKIMERFDETGANTIPVHDIDSIHLYNKDGNSLIMFPAGKTGTFELPQGVSEIREGAFKNASLQNIALPFPPLVTYSVSQIINASLI